MNSSTPKFGLRFLSRKERTVRRVTKCETREIKKRLFIIKMISLNKNRFFFKGLEPTVIPTKVAKPSRPRSKPTATSRPKPATLVKMREVKKRVEHLVEGRSRENENRSVLKSTAIRSLNNGRILQTNDLQKLSRLSCSHEFGLFHKELKGQLITNEHHLAFFQTKLYHLKDEFSPQIDQQENLQQIKAYFNQALIEHQKRHIQPDEFITLR